MNNKGTNCIGCVQPFSTGSVIWNGEVPFMTLHLEDTDREPTQNHLHRLSTVPSQIRHLENPYRYALYKKSCNKMLLCLPPLGETYCFH